MFELHQTRKTGVCGSPNVIIPTFQEASTGCYISTRRET